MAGEPLTHFVRQIRARVRGPGPTDAELLGRYVGRSDAAAFEVLVGRHGPMVLGVCRRIVRHEHDAEDAFQATFLALARGASSIARQESLGSWLHGVARRVALKARAHDAARRERARRAGAPAGGDFLAAVAWRDLQPLLDEEVGRLPQQYRTPFVLCYLEGRTYREVGRLLGCPAGTISRRLAKARELLRTRLTRRGLALPAGVLAAALAQSASPAALPPRLVPSAARAAAAALAGSGPRLLSTGRPAVAALLLGLTIGLGAGLTALPARARPQGGPPAPPKPHRPIAEAPRPADGKEITVSGRVLDPDGRPAAGARVVAVGTPPSQGGTWLKGPRPEVLGSAAADEQGRFRLSVSRGALAPSSWLHLLAGDKGYGLDGTYLDPSGRGREVTIRLGREQVVRGRLVDLQGAAAAGVRLRVSQVSDSRPGGGTFVTQEPAGGAPLWPAPLVADRQGRFTLRGVGPGLRLTLEVEDERFARRRFPIDPARAGPDGVTLALAPARPVEGIVTYQDGGRPVAGARIVVDTETEGRAVIGVNVVHGLSDERGRFRLVPFEGDAASVTVYPPEGEPYFPFRKRLTWPRGAVKRELKAELPRGVLVRGRVTEAGPGEPVRDAFLLYRPRGDNAAARADAGLAELLRERVVQSGPGGAFQLTVLPGPGHLLVKAPTPHYVHVETSSGELDGGKPASRRLYPDGLAALDVDPKAARHDVTVRLRRGATVSGQVLRPDGKPVEKVTVVCRTLVPNGFSFYENRRDFSGGRFEVTGLDPEKSYPVFFLDGASKLGAVVELSGKQAGRAVTVRLWPCGSASTRVVDQNGAPLADHPQLAKRPLVYLDLVVTPGIPLGGRGGVHSDSIRVLNLVSYFHVRTDAEGKITFPLLIPGATYRIVASEPGRGLVSKREFRVEAGKTLALPDLVIERAE